MNLWVKNLLFSRAFRIHELSHRSLWLLLFFIDITLANLQCTLYKDVATNKKIVFKIRKRIAKCDPKRNRKTELRELRMQPDVLSQRMLAFLISWLNKWLPASCRLPDWLNDWLTDWQTDRLTDWLTDWLAGWLTDRRTDQLIDWLNYWPTDWLAGWIIDWLTERTNERKNEQTKEQTTENISDLTNFSYNFFKV